MNAGETALMPFSFEAWRRSIYDMSYSHTRDWFLVKEEHCPWVLLISVGYIFLIVYLGQKIMANRKAFDLKPITTAYNLVLTLLSLYMFVEIVRQAVINNYGIFCNAVDPTEKGLGMARVLYMFYLSKVLEFLDTIFMVLRKKSNQISFLHCYHHCTIFPFWWFILVVHPGGDAYWTAMLNSFVHIWMYSYYFFTALGYKCPWKKYITMLQLAQFCLFIGQCAYCTPIHCIKPAIFENLLLAYALSLIILFGNFYMKSYVKKTK